jgi:hypothetical protein
VTILEEADCEQLATAMLDLMETIGRKDALGARLADALLGPRDDAAARLDAAAEVLAARGLRSWTGQLRDLAQFLREGGDDQLRTALTAALAQTSGRGRG